MSLGSTQRRGEERYPGWDEIRYRKTYLHISTKDTTEIILHASRICIYTCGTLLDLTRAHSEFGVCAVSVISLSLHSTLSSEWWSVIGGASQSRTYLAALRTWRGGAGRDGAAPFHPPQTASGPSRSCSIPGTSRRARALRTLSSLTPDSCRACKRSKKGTSAGAQQLWMNRSSPFLSSKMLQV